MSVQLSVVIISCNRRATLLANLRQLGQTLGLPGGEWELIVVDNGSLDGTAGAVMEDCPRARVIRLRENIGMPARNVAIGQARGEFVLLLDDDSHPQSPAAVPSLINHMRQAPRCGAAVARITLPGGAEEASALPAVLIGCGTLLRKSAIDQVGAFPPDFFRQAEEYDLSFRLWHAGWSVDRIDTAEIRHNKSPHGRSGELAVRMDLRNNMVLADRYLPLPWRKVYREDWQHRYSLIAHQQGQAHVIEQATAEADMIAVDPQRLRRQEVSSLAVEAMFQIDRQERDLALWSRGEGVRNVVIVDYGKNLHATVRAAAQVGVQIEAIIDTNFGNLGQNYRGIPIVPPPSGPMRNIDGLVVSNINPAQRERLIFAAMDWLDGPILSFGDTLDSPLRRAA